VRFQPFGEGRLGAFTAKATALGIDPARSPLVLDCPKCGERALLFTDSMNGGAIYVCKACYARASIVEDRP
jgi:predicted RNA-binding Zn-ribbon protein involved in translation (DUF1610 family)